MKKQILLEKTNEVGNLQYWKCDLDDTFITTEWGIKGSDNIQIKEEQITDGKNIGKKNELTPEDVALDLVNRKARGKLDRGYSLIKGKIDAPKSKVAKDTNFDVPKPMLANKFQDHIKKFKPGDTVIIQPKLDGCLSKDTEVMLEKLGKQTLGYVVDNEIKDRIKSYDIKNDKVIFSNIIGHGKDIELSEDVEWFLITLEDGTTIKATSNHPFFMKDIKAYRRCDELKEGDYLYLDK